jgi:hypothetical protein
MYAYIYYIAVQVSLKYEQDCNYDRTSIGSRCTMKVVIFSRTDITILILNQSTNDNNNQGCQIDNSKIRILFFEIRKSSEFFWENQKLIRNGNFRKTQWLLWYTVEAKYSIELLCINSYFIFKSISMDVPTGGWVWRYVLLILNILFF